jgi:VanZ family protein
VKGATTARARFTNSEMLHQRLARYGPLVFWATLIFIGSTDVLSASHTGGYLRQFALWLFPHLSEGTLKIFHLVGRKAGHFTEYAVLALLAARAFRASTHETLRHRWFWVSLVLIVVYSLSDEFHQSFYPSRTASIYDCMIDSVGGLVALTILWWRSGKTGNKHNPPEDFKSSVAA